jgi:hypothetical protein
MLGFYNTQKVVCVDASRSNHLKQGETYPIRDIMVVCSCNGVSLDVGFDLPPHFRGRRGKCTKCGKRSQPLSAIFFGSWRFVPLENIEAELKREQTSEKKLSSVMEMKS